MTPDKTALFSDLDGTLFDSHGVVSSENRAAIDEYIAAGGLFAVSTGREPRNALKFLPGVSMNAPSVVLNGAAVYDYAAGEYSCESFVDREAVDPLLRRALGEIPGLDFQVYTREGILYCTPEATAEPHFLELHRPCVFTTLDALGDVPFFKCVLMAPPETDPALRDMLLAADGNGFRYVPGTTDVGGTLAYHELLPPDASKGSALRALRAHPKLRGRVILAVGDYWNDYELLREADIPVAPANAIPEIRELCAHITVSNNEHAIAHILRGIIPAL